MYHFGSINDIFKFGKYSGLPFSAVILTNPEYIYWCLNNIGDFELTISAIREIREFFPSFIIAESFKGHIVLDDGNGDSDDYYSHDYRDNSYRYDDDEHYEGRYYDEDATFGRYAGSYAQDVLGYSDDDIDTIFDGDPSAVWNIE